MNSRTETACFAGLPSGSRSVSGLEPAGRRVAWRLLALAVLAGGVAGNLPAPTLSVAGLVPTPPYGLTVWNTAHGLPDARVQALAQTRDGFLWVGTVSGLARFDGLQFTLFNQRNVSALRSENVLALAEDHSGRLWVGTADGLICHTDRRFVRCPDTNLTSVSVLRLVPARGGGVWAATSRRLFRVMAAADGRTTVEAGPTLPTPAFFEDDQGQVWPADRLLDEPGRAFLAQHEPAAPGGPVLQLAVRSPAAYWLGTAQHLYRLPRPAAPPVVVWKVAASNEFIRALWAEPEGGAWVGFSTGRLVHWRPDASPEVFLPGSLGLPADMIHALTRDREGNVWVGSENGLACLSPHTWRAFGGQHGLPALNSWVAYAAPDGTLWQGTDAGAFGFHGTNIVHYSTTNGLPGNAVRSILLDRQGRLWIGTTRGLAVVREGTLQHVPLPGALSGNKVRTIIEDARGEIWVGSEGGAHRVSGRQSRWLTRLDGLPEPDVRAIAEVRPGELWFGTAGGGIAVFESEPRRVYTTAHGLPSDRVEGIARDAQGRWWVATARGLGVWQDGRFRGLTPRDGLFEDAINCVLDDQHGGLWLSGDRGIYRLDQREVAAFLQGERQRVSPAVFGVVDGLPSDETNGGRSHPAGCFTPAGEVVFPTTAGLAVADLTTLGRRRVAPLIAITGVRVDSTEMLGDDSAEAPDVGALRARTPAGRAGMIVVPAGAGRLVEIHYTACSFTLPTRTRFRYRLEGLETEWTEADTRRTAYYTDLRPGRYRFVVEACNSRGVWSESPATLALVHPPELVELPAFRIAMAVLLIALGAGLYRLQQAIRLRLRLAEERSLVERERARIARDIHDDLGAKLTRVVFLSQMAEHDAAGQQCQPPVQASLTEAALEAVQSLAEVVWATNPERDNLGSLVSFMCQQAEKFVAGTPVRLLLDVPRNLPQLTLGSDYRHHLFRVVKEALKNALKHAQARHIVLRVRLAREVVRVAVTDDGRGFRLQEVVNLGNGLLNMRSWATALGGRLRILGRPGRGAWVLLRVRLPEPARRITARSTDGRHP